MIGMVGKNGIETPFGCQPVAVIGDGERKGRPCVRIGRIKRQCALGGLVDQGRR